MFWGLSPGGTAHESQIFPNVTVLLVPVCPDRPPDVYICWALGLLVPCVLLSIVCSLPSCYLSLFQLLHLCVPRYPRLSPYLASWCLQSCADPLSFVVCVLCWLCNSSLPACLFFPLRGSFCCSLFYFIIKRNILLRLSPRLHLSSQSLTPTIIAFCKQPFQGHWKTCKPFIHLCICSTCFWETAITIFMSYLTLFILNSEMCHM